MTERPILFNGEMVRAILEGRKTMTRRVVKTNFNIVSISSNDEFRKSSPYPLAADKSGKYIYINTDTSIIGIPCPYGRVGDHLWVRETWAKTDFGIFYRADDNNKYESDGKWRPSIFIPRWASRITLEITNIRVERLQEITNNDAQLEGCAGERYRNQPDYEPWEEFQNLWESINGKKYPWASNPWVWVIEFRRLEN